MRWNASWKESDESLKPWSSSWFSKKNKKQPFNLKCNYEVTIKAVPEDMGAKENGAKV